MLLITSAGMFAAILVAVAVFLSAGEERREVREALRGLSDHDLPANMREQEMLKSMQERVLAPFMARLSGLLGRFTPAGYTQTVREKLVKAGHPAGLDADRFLTLKVLGAVSIVFWPFFAFKIAGLGGFYGMIVTGLLWGISFFGPDVFVQRKADQRQYLIATRLPDVLDLLVISVEAGLGFEQAIDRTVDSVPGPLADEFRRMLQETRMGASRADAFRAMDERCQVPELRSFILAMLQADTFGVSIGRMLRQQADDMRIRRRQRAQEAAQKAPVKMLFPLMFCIFPSLFVVILGPAVLQISKAGLS
ncbi:MAG TPA: type II secretion system F family protein [Acidimicrobiia bacterium]|jgi:tight adherence protein C|nr:type II secretion system F family protein [Acidimicrobiia bacterium]